MRVKQIYGLTIAMIAGSALAVAPAQALGRGSANSLEMAREAGMVVTMGDSYMSGEGGRWIGNGPIKDNTVSSREYEFSYGDSHHKKEERSDIYGDTYYQKKDGKPQTTGKPGCHRSNGAEIYAANLPKDKYKVENIACSGAETKHILNESFKGEIPQIQQLENLAKDNKVQHVVVSIGGNDLNLSGVASRCVLKYAVPGIKAITGDCMNGDLADPTSKLYVGDKGINKRVQNVILEVLKVLKRNSKGPIFSVALQSYPFPFPPSGIMNPIEGDYRFHDGGCPFSNLQVDWLRRTAIALNQNLRSVATSVGVDFIDMRDALYGHELCGKKNEVYKQARKGEGKGEWDSNHLEWMRWIDGVNIGTAIWDKTIGKLKESWAAGDPQVEKESLHPNHLGQISMGACIRQYIDKIDNDTNGEYANGMNAVCHAQVTQSPQSTVLLPKARWHFPGTYQLKVKSLRQTQWNEHAKSDHIFGKVTIKGDGDEKVLWNTIRDDAIYSNHDTGKRREGIAYLAAAFPRDKDGNFTSLNKWQAGVHAEYTFSDEDLTKAESAFQVNFGLMEKDSRKGTDDNYSHKFKITAKQIFDKMYNIDTDKALMEFPDAWHAPEAKDAIFAYTVQITKIA